MADDDFLEWDELDFTSQNDKAMSSGSDARNVNVAQSRRLSKMNMGARGNESKSGFAYNIVNGISMALSQIIGFSDSDCECPLPRRTSSLYRHSDMGHHVIPEHLSQQTSVSSNPDYIEKFFTNHLYDLYHFNPRLGHNLPLGRILLKEGQAIFRAGDKDDNIYYIVTGSVVVTVTSDDGKEYVIVELGAGKHVASLLSIMDVVIGAPANKCVTKAIAQCPTEVLVLKTEILGDRLRKDTATLFHFVQNVIIRLHRVTFTAMRSYLGLSKEFYEKKPITKHLENQLALNRVCYSLGIQDCNLLENYCKVKDYKHGEVLYKQGSRNTTVVFVLSGMLSVTQDINFLNSPGVQQVVLTYIEPDTLIGTISLITGFPSFFNLLAHSDTSVAEIESSRLCYLMKTHPNILCSIAKCISMRLSRLARQADIAADWRHLRASTYLYEFGDTPRALYVVLRGRLQAHTANGNRPEWREFGRNDVIGVKEMITNRERTESVMALRDAELAVVPREFLGYITTEYPLVQTRLLNLLINHAVDTDERNPLITAVLAEHGNLCIPRPIAANIDSVAIVPASATLPIVQITQELHHHLTSIGTTMILNEAIVESMQLDYPGCVDRRAYPNNSNYQWLDAIEDGNRMLLYVCDPTPTSWSRQCLNHADLILTVAFADQDPNALGEMEWFVHEHPSRVQKVLLLLHSSDTTAPLGTVLWLNVRPWCNSHLHARFEDRIFEDPKTHAQIMHAIKPTPSCSSDFARVARMLTGTAIGVVLGGGGAKGVTQLGYLEALRQKRIPIDMVGGTSIGSLIGGLLADETACKLDNVKERLENWIQNDMSSLTKVLIDFTYPYTSYFKGSGYNHSLTTIFKDKHIEDLWLPYFCVATDLWGCCKLRILASGTLWQCIRASSTIVPYLPPFPDPDNGHYLVDGAYVNNLPADIMYKMGAQNIFACDIGAGRVRRNSYVCTRNDQPGWRNYGHDLSGWWVLFGNTKEYDIPSAFEIQTALQFLTNERLIQTIRESTMCEYFRVPIDNYTGTDWNKFRELYALGYSAATNYFNALKTNGRLENIFKEIKEDDKCVIGQQKFVPFDIALNLTSLAGVQGVNKIPDSSDCD